MSHFAFLAFIHQNTRGIASLTTFTIAYSATRSHKYWIFPRLFLLIVRNAAVVPHTHGYLGFLNPLLSVYQLSTFLCFRTFLSIIILVSQSNANNLHLSPEDDLAVSKLVPAPTYPRPHLLRFPRPREAKYVSSPPARSARSRSRRTVGEFFGA